MLSSVPGRHFARNLVERRNLLFQLVRRDFRQRFVGSVAGWLWNLIHPLVLLLSWIFVFQWCLKTTLGPDEVTQNYSFFLFTGFLPWLLFSETVQRSSTSLLENANLITKTVFPSEVVPVAVFLSSLLNHLLALGIALAAIFLWGHFVPTHVVVLPFYMICLGLLGIGLGWIVAGLQVYLRDTAQILSVILTFWMWTTPIFISEKQYPAQLKFVLAINPLAYIVRAYRTQLLSEAYPSAHDLLIVAAFAISVFLLGGLFFRHLKSGFADVL